MPFVGCSECGGYFELEPNESFYDFDQCQCGGKLLYYKTYQDLINNKPHTPAIPSNSNAPTLHNPSYELEQQIKSNITFNFEKNQKENPSLTKKILKKINFVGIFAGLCMFISLTLISYVLCFDYLYNTAIYVFSSTNDFYYTIATLGFLTYFIIFVISIASAGMVTFIGGSKKYTVGFINGILFALVIIFVITGYIFSIYGLNSILMVLLVMSTVFLTLCSFGGILGVFIRKMLFPNKQQNYF